MAMFKLGFDKVSVVRSDLTFQRLSKSQDPINLSAITNLFGRRLSLQLLEAVLNALEGIVRLRAHQTQSGAVPRGDGSAPIEDLAEPRTLIASGGATPRKMPKL